jgi:adenine phosphoribosyltransferase
MNSYLLEICGLSRQLPIVKIGPKMSIASFNLLGDTELVEKIASQMIEEIKKFDFDYIVGPEVKVVPLIYQISHQLKIPRYIIARKKIMGYMKNPVLSKIKTDFVLDGLDANLVKNKKVIIIDDVVSTGRTINGLLELLKSIKCQVVGIAVVLKQGETKVNINIPTLYLGRLPLMINK